MVSMKFAKIGRESRSEGERGGPVRLDPGGSQIAKAAQLADSMMEAPEASLRVVRRE
jgi:hypothetical protein